MVSPSAAPRCRARAMSLVSRLRKGVFASRGLGPRVLGQELAARAWSTKPEFELECLLDQLPDPPRASVPITMVERDPRSFDGFERELERVRGFGFGQALRRAEACRAGLPGLHVASDEAGEPLYAQWLLTPSDRDSLARIQDGPWRPLRQGEVLLEFAYAFVASRGKGAMSDGMGQLLAIARDRGDQRACTYVRTDNVPSLRGCANVGLRPVRVAVTRSRIGWSRCVMEPVDAAAAETWERVTAPRG